MAEITKCVIDRASPLARTPHGAYSVLPKKTLAVTITKEVARHFGWHYSCCHFFVASCWHKTSGVLSLSRKNGLNEIFRTMHNEKTTNVKNLSKWNWTSNNIHGKERFNLPFCIREKTAKFLSSRRARFISLSVGANLSAISILRVFQLYVLGTIAVASECAWLLYLSSNAAAVLSVSPYPTSCWTRCVTVKASLCSISTKPCQTPMLCQFSRILLPGAGRFARKIYGAHGVLDLFLYCCAKISSNWHTFCNGMVQNNLPLPAGPKRCPNIPDS